jgi:hypothetical protein
MKAHTHTFSFHCILTNRQVDGVFICYEGKLTRTRERLLIKAHIEWWIPLIVCSLIFVSPSIHPAPFSNEFVELPSSDSSTSVTFSDIINQYIWRRTRGTLFVHHSVTPWLGDSWNRWLNFAVCGNYLDRTCRLSWHSQLIFTLVRISYNYIFSFVCIPFLLMFFLHI